MPAEPILILPGLAFCVSNKLWDRSGRYFWVHLHDSRPLADTGNEDDVTDEVIIEIFVERRIDRVDCRELHDGVAVGLRSSD